jgi:hypothetical protein
MMTDARICPRGHRWYVGLDYSCPTCRRERQQERQAKAAAERKDADDAVGKAVRRVR